MVITEEQIEKAMKDSLMNKLSRLQPEIVFTTEISNGILYAIGWEKPNKPTNTMSRYHLYVIGSGVSEIIFYESNVCPVGCYDIDYLKNRATNFYRHTLEKLEL